ncbi:MAG: type II toxin-antitoxin system HicA family toxin [Verrucomicrobiae bacterium]|nr:type II toxin-antitoxin system HicA family toxin [Verrucomicrobiae bacterium]
MKLPRDINGARLAHALRRLGYEVTRQTGSHMRVTTQRNGEHHKVIPNANPIRVGTLHSILKSVAAHHQMTVDQLLRELDL